MSFLARSRVLLLAARLIAPAAFLLAPACGGEQPAAEGTDDGEPTDDGSDDDEPTDDGADDDTTSGLDGGTRSTRPSTSTSQRDAGDAGRRTSDTDESSGGDVDASVSQPKDNGACCADCICRGDDPDKSSSTNGTYKVATYTIPRSSEHGGGTVYYPGDAESPFSGAVYCPPLTGVQAMYRAWGPFLASHGIALVTMDTRTTSDSVQSRGTQLAAMVKQFRGENVREGSPIKGKLAPRIGTMGWSMGGGATWIAAARDPSLKSSISMAGHNATGGGAANSRGTMVPSMQLAGQTDTSILGGMGQSQGVFGIIAESTPKILFVIRGVGHMSWGGPTAATPTAGELVLAFQKTFLDGDERWKKFLLTKPANASEWRSNVK